MDRSSNAAVSQFSNPLIKVPKKIELSQQTFLTWRKYIYDICGIYYQDNKKYLLESRLQKRINFLGLDTFEQYLDFVRYGTNSGAEKKYLFEAITINETFFFRNQPQLDALVSSILPEIIASKSKIGRTTLRIWSAASSSGEEAYSTAITFIELLKPKYPNVQLEIVGTDISEPVVRMASRGIYRDYAIRNTSSYYLKKYFNPTPEGYEIDPNIKKMVTFKSMNLYDDMSMKAMANFDVIFCANVLIYFDTDSKRKVVSHLYNSLTRGGYLFIGYSETLQNISKAFKLVSFPKTIGYKKE